MSPPSVLLSASFEKLSGSRTWLHRVKTPQWKPKRVWLTSNAHIHHSPDLHLTDAHLPTPGLLIPPGAARIATYTEQVRHARQFIFVVTAVHASAHADRDAKKHLIYFAASTEEEMHTWVNTIVDVSIEALRLSGDHLFLNPFLVAWGHVHKLKPKAVVSVARDINFKLTEDRFRVLYEAAFGEPLGKEVTPYQFAQVMTSIAIEELLHPIFKVLGLPAATPSLSAEQLASLLSKTVDEAKAILAGQGVPTCSPALLLHLLHHPDNSVVDAGKAAELHDMTQPLNRYLIASSHNTYLTGDQLKSNSSAAMYRIVLQRGCRCVEVDVWDGDDGVPIVTHGHTITSSETFENVLLAIRDHSFSHGNPYPVIVSIESHLGKEQQLVAANLIKKILGEHLYVPGPQHREDDVLPSPSDLQNKIVIKAKTGMSVLRPEFREEMKGTEMEGSGDLEDDDSDDAADSSQNASAVNVQPSKSGSQTSSPFSSRDKEKVSKVVPEFAELVFMAGGNRKTLMALWKDGVSGKDRYMAASCVSINEKKISDVYLNNAIASIREYNSHGFTRVYPKGSRVDSSNYFPIQAQFLGCQIVALNWQCNDTALAINQARFLHNGGRGFVLKSAIPEPENTGTLQIQILSAFLLLKADKAVVSDIIDPYCTLKVYDTVFGADDECCSFKHETKAAKSNGFTPSWQEIVTVPIRNRELAVMNFKIYDRDRASEDDVIGYRSVPVSLLRPGLRSLPLNASKEGTPITIPGTDQRPSILCNIMWV